MLNQRLVLAQRPLETTDKPIDLVAKLSGFSTTVLLRRSFIRAFDSKPSTYRREFCGR